MSSSGEQRSLFVKNKLELRKRKWTDEDRQKQILQYKHHFVDYIKGLWTMKEETVVRGKKNMIAKQSFRLTKKEKDEINEYKRKREERQYEKFKIKKLKECLERSNR